MKTLSIIFSLVACSVMSAKVVAEEVLATDDTSAFHVGASFSPSVLNSEYGDNEIMGYEAFLGYRFNQYFMAQAGYGNYTDNDDSGNELGIDPWIGRLKAMYPISGYASVYLGGGAAYDSDIEETYPMFNTGVYYRLSDNWVADVGYQSIYDIGVNEENLHTLNISLVYEFYTPEPQPVEPEIRIVEKIVEKIVEVPAQCPELCPLPELPQKPSCEIVNKPYLVKKGDWLIRIAKKHDMTLKELLGLNPEYRDNGRDVNLIYPGETINLNYYECE